MNSIFQSFFGNHNLNKVYLAETLRNVAMSMVSIFVPLYLIKHGYSLREVLIYFVVQSLVHIALMIPIGKFGAKAGFRYCILISTPFIIGFYYLLYTLLEKHWPLLILGIVYEIGGSFYWVGRHVFFARTTQTHKRGTQIGIAKILKSVFTTPAPLIGALILAHFGIGYLLVVASVILAAAALPLFFVEEPEDQIRFRVADLWKGQSWRTTVMFMNQGVDNVMDDVAWSIYAFFNILKTYVIFGTVQVVSSIFSLFVNYTIGRLVDKKGRKIMQLGGFTNLFVWIARYFARTNLQVYVIDSARGVTGEFSQVSFGATSYELASRNHVAPFIIWRELFIQAGKVLALCTILLVGLKTSFILGILYSLVYVFVKFDADDSNPGLHPGAA